MSSDIEQKLIKEIKPSYFSQHGEERIINWYLKKNPEKEMGIYIDIGSGPPIIISNTYYYYTRKWQGLLVEPQLIYHAGTEQHRKRDILVKSAISDYNGKIELCNNAVAGSYRGEIKREENPDKIVTVDCMTMNTLIEKYPKFKKPDFIDIDIETGEDKLLAQCDFNIFKPKLIVIEYNAPGLNKSGKIERIDWHDVWGHYLDPFYNRVEVFTGNAYYLRKE